MKTVEIIPLALRKAKRRGINSELVESSVSEPDQIVEGYGGRSVAQKRIILAGKRAQRRSEKDYFSWKRVFAESSI